VASKTSVEKSGKKIWKNFKKADVQNSHMGQLIFLLPFFLASLELLLVE
jgi:hypothetical protein